MKSLQTITKNAESEAQSSAQIRFSQRGNVALPSHVIHNAWVASRAYQSDVPTKAEGDQIESAYKAAFQSEWEALTK